MKNKIYRCCMALCLLGLLLGFSGCGSAFERAIPDETAAMDFWNHFDMDILAEYFPDPYSLNQGEFVVLARGMAGEECNLSGKEFEGLPSVEAVEEEMEESGENWILAKTSVNDYYTSCEFYGALLYSTNEAGEYQYSEIGQGGFQCKPLAAHTLDYYMEAVREFFDENGVMATNIYESGQQEFYESGSETLVYNYDIERGNIYGTVRVFFKWDGKGEFIPCDYEYSEALQAQLPPKGAVFPEECEEDRLYVLRDGNYYPLTALEEVDFYDAEENVEEKFCVYDDGSVLNKNVKVVSVREEDSIVFFSKDTYTDYSGYFFAVWPLWTDKYINADKKIWNLNWENELPRFNIQKGGEELQYELAEVSINGKESKDWKDQMLRSEYRGYICGNKGDQIRVGGYRGSFYEEDTYTLDCRVIERGQRVDKLTDYMRAEKKGYYEFNKLPLIKGGMYYEESNDCVICIE